MLRFLDTLIDFPVAHATGSDGLSVLDSRARRGDSPPLHIHHTEDECFHVVEGELVALVDGDPRRVRAGQTALLPKGVPHTYCVVSEEARWLVVTTQGDFERFVRAVSFPAGSPELPPHAGPPTPAQAAALAEAAASNHIELVGPPLSVESQEVAQAA